MDTKKPGWKLTPMDTKKPGKAKKNAKANARKAKDAKLQAKANFLETLRGTPQTPCASFLTSYNKIEDAMQPCKKAKKTKE